MIRAAKSLGYAYQINSPDKAALALALLEASEALPHKRRPAVSPPDPYSPGYAGSSAGAGS